MIGSPGARVIGNDAHGELGKTTDSGVREALAKRGIRECSSAMEAHVLHSGEGETHLVGASRVTIEATGEETAPSGWEGYLRDLGAAFGSGEPPSEEAIGRIASRYDFKVSTSP
jgi:hypothetical protein